MLFTLTNILFLSILILLSIVILLCITFVELDNKSKRIKTSLGSSLYRERNKHATLVELERRCRGSPNFKKV